MVDKFVECWAFGDHKQLLTCIAEEESCHIYARCVRRRLDADDSLAIPVFVTSQEAFKFRFGLGEYDLRAIRFRAKWDSLSLVPWRPMLLTYY